MSLFVVSCRTPLPSPEAAQLIAPVHDTTVHSGNVTFQWDSVANAAGYQFQIDDKSSFYTPVFDTTISLAPAAVQSFDHFLHDAAWYWRVRARGRDSTWGDWSAGQVFTISTYRIVGQVCTRSYPQAITVRDSLAFIADGQAGLSIYRISDPAQPTFVAGIMDTLDEAWGIAVSDKYAYLSYGRKQLQIVDIHRLDSLQLLGNISYTTGYGYDVKILDSAHVVAADHGKFSVFDVSDPNFPRLLYEPHAWVRAAALQDTVAYLACEQLGLITMSISLQNEPTTWSIMRTQGDARDVAVQGNYAYVSDGRDGLTVIDVTDKANPVIVSILALPGGGYGNRITVHGSTVYLADGVAGLAVIDVTDPRTPVLQAMLKTPYAKSAFVTPDGRILFTDRDWGLIIVEKEQP